MMGLFGLFKSNKKEKLSKSYEKERQKWIAGGFNKGTGEKSAKMKRLDKKLRKCAEKEWKKNPKRNKDPNFRWTDANRWDKD